MVESVRQWQRFVHRDANVLALALATIAVCYALSLLPSIGAGIASAWLDPSQVRTPTIESIGGALIAVGLLGGCAGLVQFVSYAAWIAIFVIAFGGVLSRVVLPLAVIGALMIILMASGFFFGAFASASGGSMEEIQEVSQQAGFITGGVSSVLMTIGLAWVVQAVQRSVTPDRSGLLVLFLLAVLAAAGGLISMASMQLGTERAVDSALGLGLAIFSAIALAAFHVMLILRLLAIRKEAIRRAAEMRDVQYGAALVSSGASAPPLIRQQ